MVAADVVPPAQADVRRRWAELLRRIFEVDPLRCPRCGHAMRVVACITAAGVGLVLLTTVAGSLVPGLRAMRVSPVVAMKAE